MEYSPMVDFIGMAGLLLLFVCIAALEARYRKRKIQKIQKGWKSPQSFYEEARHWQRVDYVDIHGTYFRGILAGMVNPARIRQWRLTPYVRLD